MWKWRRQTNPQRICLTKSNIFPSSISEGGTCSWPSNNDNFGSDASPPSNHGITIQLRILLLRRGSDLGVSTRKSRIRCGVNSSADTTLAGPELYCVAVVGGALSCTGSVLRSESGVLYFCIVVSDNLFFTSRQDETKTEKTNLQLEIKFKKYSSSSG